MNIWCTTSVFCPSTDRVWTWTCTCVNSRQKDTFTIPIWRPRTNGVVAVTMTMPGQSRGFASVPLHAAACVNIIVAPLVQGRHRRRIYSLTRCYYYFRFVTGSHCTVSASSLSSCHTAVACEPQTVYLTSSRFSGQICHTRKTTSSLQLNTFFWDRSDNEQLNKKT